MYILRTRFPPDLRRMAGGKIFIKGEIPGMKKKCLKKVDFAALEITSRRNVRVIMAQIHFKNVTSTRDLVLKYS